MNEVNGGDVVFIALCVCVCAANRSIRELGTLNSPKTVKATERTFKLLFCRRSKPKLLGGDMHKSVRLVSAAMYRQMVLVFTARCTLVQSAVLRSHVVCLSVSLSVTLVDCDHIG